MELAQLIVRIQSTEQNTKNGVGDSKIISKLAALQQLACSVLG
jgi:hypothetical protein